MKLKTGMRHEYYLSSQKPSKQFKSIITRKTLYPKMGRVQHCASCHNHGHKSPKRGHVCKFEKCKCILCKLLKLAQMAMRHQQRVWRHQKEKLKLEDLTNLLDVDGETKPQVCDKCRNHNELIRKRNHKCKYFDCTCDYCTLTFKRREIMKHLQRVRRSGVTSDHAAEEFFERNKSQFGEADEENNCSISEEDAESEELPPDDEQHSSPESFEERQSPGASINERLVKNEKYEILDFSKEEHNEETSINDNIVQERSFSARTMDSTEVLEPTEVLESVNALGPNEPLPILPCVRERYHFQPTPDRHSPSLKRPYPTDCDSPPPLIPVGFSRIASVGGTYHKRRSVSPITSHDRTERRDFHNRDHLPHSLDMRFSLDRSFPLTNQPAIVPQFPYNTSMSVEQLTAFNASLVQSMCPVGRRKQPDEIQQSVPEWMPPQSFFSRSVEAIHQAGHSAFFHQLQANEQRNQKRPIRPQPINYRPNMVLPRNLLSQMMFPPYTINFGSSDPHYQSAPTSLERLSNLVDSSRIAQARRFHM